MIRLETLCFLFIFALLFTNSVSAQDQPKPDSEVRLIAAPKKFESKEGNFSINIFEPPLLTRILDSNKSEKKAADPAKQFMWQLKKTAYTVMYMPLFDEEGSPAQQFDEMNSGTRNAIGRTGGRLIYEKEISSGKYPGREFRAILPNGVTQIYRNYWINKMGYLVTAGFVFEEDEKEALEVLDSFKLLTESK